MKRLLSALLLAVMLCTCIVLPVNAEDGSAPATGLTVGTAAAEAAPNTDASYIIGTDYATLKEAFASAPTDGTSVTYTLSCDMTYNNRVTLPAGAKVTLDLAGHTLTYVGTSPRSCFYLYGSLTVIGSGSVVNTSEQYAGHVFTVWQGGSLTISGNALFSADGGNVIHIAGGTVVSVSAGTFTSAQANAVNLMGSSRVISVSGGVFSGVNALYAGDRSVVNNITGGSFTGTKNGMYVKVNARINTLGKATVSATVGGKFALANLGTVKTVDGATLISAGAGVMTNYGTVTTVKSTASFEYTSPVRGVGSAVVNYGTVNTFEGKITANANGILNHGGKMSTVKPTVETVRGIGIYNRAGGTITNINANISVCNRAAVYNTGANTKITSFTGGTYISTCEKEGSTDDRAIGIYTANGATVGRIAVTKVESYGACIANAGGTITAIQSGIYTSSTISIANKDGGVIGSIRSGTFTPDYDWDTVFPGQKRSMSVIADAKLALLGGADTQYPASQWNNCKTQFFAVPLTEEQFTALTVPDSAYARYVNHTVTDETAAEDIYHYYDTYLKDPVFTGEQTVRFFTAKIVPRGDGDITYYLGLYSDEAQTLSSVYCKAESDSYTFSLSVSVSAAIAATPLGQRPLTYSTDQKLVFCEEQGRVADLTLSGEARAALLGGSDITTPAAGQSGTAQFYVIRLTEEQFNLLTPQNAVPVRYVNHTVTEETATEDVYHYYTTRLSGGQITGDSGYGFFTSKIVRRDDLAETACLLGIYAQTAQDTASVRCTITSDTARAVISIDGMAPLAATADGQYPTVYAEGQALTECDDGKPIGRIVIPASSSFFEASSVEETAWTGKIGSPEVWISSVGYRGKALAFAPCGQSYYSPTIDLSEYITSENQYTVAFRYAYSGTASGAPFASTVRTDRVYSFSQQHGTNCYATLPSLTPLASDQWGYYTCTFTVTAADIAALGDGYWNFCFHEIDAGVSEILIDNFYVTANPAFDVKETTVTETETWVMNELVFLSTESYADPYRDVTVDLILTGNGETYTIPCFWDGFGIWRARFYCPTAGTWSYTTRCSNAADLGLNGRTGTVSVTEYSGSLALYRHGFVKAEDKYFTYDDGVPFFYLGDTHWSLGQEEEDKVLKMVSVRAEQGFTVIQSEPIGASFDLTNGFDFSDITGLQSYDRKFSAIADAGLLHANAEFFFPAYMETFIQKNGGYSAVSLGTAGGSAMYDLSDTAKEELERLTRYWVARYSAFPVLWTLGQEVDNDFYWSGSSHPSWSYVNNPYKLVAQYIEQYDAYGHPLTAHQENTGETRVTNSAFNAMPEHDWFAAQWSPSVSGTLSSDVVREYYASAKPVVLYEGRYCYLWTKNFGARAQGWIAYLSGMYGYGWGGQDTWSYQNTYGEDTNSGDDQLDTVYAAEKVMACYEDSYSYTSAAEVGYMRRFFEDKVGIWNELLPSVVSGVTFQPQSGAFGVVAATQDSRCAVLYLYNTDSRTRLDADGANRFHDNDGSNMFPFYNSPYPAKANSNNPTGTGSVIGLSDGSYTLTWFNPVNNTYTDGGSITVEDGEVTLPRKPSGGDMVLLLTKN